MGDDPLFHVPAYHLVHPAELAVYAVLGVAGGLGSVCFVKLLLGLRAAFTKMPKSTLWLQPTAGGLACGIMGFFVPEVLGVGYNYVERVLNGDLIFKMLVVLAVMKICATALSYGSGNAGGIFGPSLFIGAMIGGAVGSVAHQLFPAYTAGPGAYALVGMGTAFAGIVRTPLTSVIMIFEMTRDYSIIVPLMISNLIAYFISYKLQREPIYEALAHQDGVHLPASESSEGRIRVSQVLQPALEVLSPDLPVVEAAVLLNRHDLDAFPVGDAQGLRGMIRKWELQSAIAQGRGPAKLAELIGAKFPHLHPDQGVAIALEMMGESGYNVLPVVSRANVRRLEGIVTLEDILDAYGVSKLREDND